MLEMESLEEIILRSVKHVYYVFGDCLDDENGQLSKIINEG